MEVTTLVAFLAPLLPYLIKGGEGAAEYIGKKFGAAVWDRARAIWAALHPKVVSTPGLQDIVADLERDTNNTAARGALVYHFGKLLAGDAALKATVERLWSDTDARGVQNVIASGQGAVAVGGDASGTIITGTVLGNLDRKERP
jgi:hypothetical protein